MKYLENDLGPTLKKSAQQILSQKLKHDYGLLGEKVINLLADDILLWYHELGIDGDGFYPGQVMWLAVALDETHHPHKRIEDTRLVPVKLTLHSNEDIEMMFSGKRWREVLRFRIERLCREAVEQGGVLTQSDLAVLLSINRSTVQRYISIHEKTEDVDIPYRGKLHDIGPTVSHKAEIIELMVKGYATPVVGARLNHSIMACDNYFKDYKKVIKLRKVFPLSEIPALSGLSKSLVETYLKLAEKLEYRL